MIIKQKHYIISIVILIAVGVGKHYYAAEQFNNLIEQVKKDLETEKQAALNKKDTVIIKRNRIINQLTLDNEKAKKDSKYWYNKAKRVSVNPAYNIDFLTAADELARSKYRPGKGDSNVNKTQNN